MARMAAEKNFENRVKKYLKSEGCWLIKYWGGARFTKSGIPDLLFCCNGIFFAVELKAPNGTPSDLQKANVRAVNACGGVGIVLYPDGFESFKKLIEGVKNCKHHIPVLNALKVANTNTNCDILIS